MPPPTNAELAQRERMIRQALAALDPQGQTPAILRECEKLPQLCPPRLIFLTPRPPHPTLMYFRQSIG